MTSWNNCRLCGDREIHQTDPAMAMLRYGTRHYAHMKCLHERGRLVDVLKGMAKHQLESLPYFGLQKLGMLDLVKGLAN